MAKNFGYELACLARSHRDKASKYKLSPVDFLMSAAIKNLWSFLAAKDPRPLTFSQGSFSHKYFSLQSSDLRTNNVVVTPTPRVSRDRSKLPFSHAFTFEDDRLLWSSSHA